MNGGVTVVIPTIPTPERAALLTRALASVHDQLRQPDAIIVEPDTDHAGPGPTRNRALDRVDTEYVALLDDDDELLPHHLRACLRRATLSGADLVYPQPEYVGWTEADAKVPFGFDFNDALLRQRNYIPITVVVRAALLRAVGGFRSPADAPVDEGHPCEDWGAWLALLDAGATFEALHQVTWRWHHHDGKHQGRPW